MADGWIAAIAIVALLVLAVCTSLVCGAWERVQKYRVDRSPFSRSTEK